MKFREIVPFGVLTVPMSFVITMISVAIIISTESTSHASVSQQTDLNISLGAVVGLSATIAGGVMTGYVALLRYTIGQEKQRFNDAIAEVRAKLADAINDFKKAESELATLRIEFVKLQGEATAMKAAIDEVRKLHVPRNEWESRMDGMERQLTQILNRLDKSSGLYSAIASAKREKGE